MDTRGGKFSWEKFVQLMRVMWRDPTTRARGAAALDRAHPGRGAELLSAMALIDRAASYDPEALADIALVRDAAAAGALGSQRLMELMRYANGARKTQADLFAPVAAIERDPYYRLS